MTGTCFESSSDTRRNNFALRTQQEHRSLIQKSPGGSALDNLGSHKGQAVCRAIRDAGAKLFFLPPYSPDLNPIEQVFSKLKTLLRKANARTVDDTCDQIGTLIASFSPREYANYLANAGYASP